MTPIQYTWVQCDACRGNKTVPVGMHFQTCAKCKGMGQIGVAHKVVPKVTPGQLFWLLVGFGALLILLIAQFQGR